MSRLLRHGRIAALVVATLLAAEPARAQSTLQTSLRFSLDWKIEGPAAIFLVPQERGYFRQEGLDVILDEGSAALEPITRVASGSHDIGFADINALIKYRDQHPTAPIKAIFMLYNKPPYAIVARKTRGITEPKHLEGKRLGAPPTGTTFGEWPLFAKLNDIDASKVTVEQIGIPVRAPMLAAGQIDAALGYSFRIYVDVKERGVQVDDIVLMPMADYKMKLYGGAVVVNAKVAAEKPDVLKKYIRALLHGLRDTIHNPTAAIEVVLKRDDALKKEVELERVRMAIRDNIVTPEVRANGFGAIDAARFEEAIGQLSLTNTFKVKPKLEDIFDASFLPSLAERRVN
jgi:NitT/TauT family transport system substrate-binding protein